MRRIAALAIALAAFLAVGCETRTNSYTFTKSNVTQMQAMQDKDKLLGTRGVEKVLSEVDSRGNARLQVYIDEENEFPGVRHAIEGLGYQIVSP